MTDKFLFGLSAALLAASKLTSAEPVCHHCEEIRLWNKENHKNYEYFDEYLTDDSDDKDKTFDKAKTADSDKAVAEKDAVKISKPISSIAR